MSATKNENADGKWKLENGNRHAVEKFPLRFSILHLRFLLIIAIAIFISGCTPPGPRALLKGKKLLERGNFSGAVEQLTTATKLLPSNAQAWNYLGVAQQHAGQFSDAMTSYQRALMLDRDLVEAHYNLGCLYLEQNRVADAKTEFTAYTLHRGNDAFGWAKLGDAQLRGGELVPAEKSFSVAYNLQTNNADALNGLGLARIQRNRPKEAAQFFAAAIAYHPDFAPAILNLAIVDQEYLHEERAALEYYHKYLDLTPQPANWNEVKAVADKLAQPEQAAANPPAQNQNPPPAAETRPQPPEIAHTAAPKTAPQVRKTETPRPEVARVRTPPPSYHAPVERPSVEHRLNTTPPHRSEPPLVEYTKNGVTPIDLPPVAPDVVQVPSAKPAPPPPPVFPRYHFLSPPKPQPGNREAAAKAFEQARTFERGSRWREAADAYAEATRLDPSWFEAQYNLGVIADRARNLQQSLAAYEMALAIRPDSDDARYNFAIELKSAGYAVDAANELKRIIAANPNDIRAQLALGNLYDQQLQDPAQAREHYLKVLQIDPHNPQATDIGFWLSRHPPQ